MEKINITKIKVAIKEAGVSQQDIADHLGLSKGAVSQALHRGKNTGYQTINKIIDAFNSLKKN